MTRVLLEISIDQGWFIFLLFPELILWLFWDILFFSDSVCSFTIQKICCYFSLIFIWLFAAFIGFGNSVLRSCIMLSVYFILFCFSERRICFTHWPCLLFFILIGDTQQIFDVGFQLSFSAVLGIYWLNQPLLKYFPKQDNYIKKLLFNTITISLSAQLVTLPLVLYYFHQFSLISILANFVIVPFSELIIIFSFNNSSYFFGIDFELINGLYDEIIQVLLKVIHWFSEVDVLFFENIPMNGVEVMSVSMFVYLLRAAILKFNAKNTMRLMMAAILFLMIRNGITAFENRKEEILVLHFNRNKVFQ